MSSAKTISVPKGMKVEIEKEKSASMKKKHKAEKMKQMSKMVAGAVKSAMKKK